MASKLFPLIISAIIALSGCSASMRGPIIDGTYEQELLECVNKAKTLQESKECRENVDRKFGIN